MGLFRLLVHCGDRELFSRTMQLTHHTFKLNLFFLLSYFSTLFIFINLLIIIINRLSLWVYLGFLGHCGDCELFSQTMELTIHLDLI